MWTPTALASELCSYRGRVWRIVEAQHRISTNRLALSLEDQSILEELADAIKPQLPPTAHGLHYLLASPFRYGHRSESRFRRASERPGIFYASESEATAIAEAAYWRLRFFARSPGFMPPKTVSEHSAFSVNLAVDRALDLASPPFDAERSRLTSDDYAPCQLLADAARQVDTQAIRYRSARDPQDGVNVALLDPAGFAEPAPRTPRTWHFRIEGGVLLALAAFPSNLRMTFTAKRFGLPKV